MHINIPGTGKHRLRLPSVAQGSPTCAKTSPHLRRDCLRRATATSALRLRGCDVRDGRRGANTEDSVDTDAVFQPPMSALNAVVEENACEPTTCGQHYTAPKPTVLAAPCRRRASAPARCIGLQHVIMQQTVPHRTALLHQSVPFCAGASEEGGRIKVRVLTSYVCLLRSFHLSQDRFVPLDSLIDGVCLDKRICGCLCIACMCLCACVRACVCVCVFVCVCHDKTNEIFILCGDMCAVTSGNWNNRMRIYAGKRPDLPWDWQRSAKTRTHLRRDCLRRATAASALRLRGCDVRDGRRVHTAFMFDTNAVFQPPMSALNAVVEENACEPTTRGPHRTGASSRPRLLCHGQSARAGAPHKASQYIILQCA